jgi:SAM-dependent methyltransferase
MTETEWSRFFGGPQRILVNATHREVHYRGLAADLLPLLGEPAGGVVLDFGCGEADAAPAFAAAGLSMLLFDAAEPIRRRLAERFAATPNLGVLSPDECRGLPPSSLDHVLLVSVAQYLPRAVLSDLLGRWWSQLKPGGDVILCDLVPPDLGMWPDLSALLGTAWRNGFLLAAVRGLVWTAFSDYSRLRGTIGLTHYSAEEAGGLLASHGFIAERLPRNPGINPSRLAFRGRKPAAG